MEKSKDIPQSNLLGMHAGGRIPSEGERLLAIEQKLKALPAIEQRLDAIMEFLRMPKMNQTAHVPNSGRAVNLVPLTGLINARQGLAETTPQDGGGRGVPRNLVKTSSQPSEEEASAVPNDPVVSREVEPPKSSLHSDSGSFFDMDEMSSEEEGGFMSPSSRRKSGPKSNRKSSMATDDAVVPMLEPVKSTDSFMMLNPRNYYRMTWDLSVVMPLLVYLTVMLPFRLTFQNEPKKFSGAYWWEFLIDILFLIDIVFNFRTGFPVEVQGAGPGEAHELIEYDRWRIAKGYAKSWLLLDILSGVPFALIEILLSGGGGAENFKSAKALKLLRFLKLGRLLKMDKILKSLDRDTLDSIEDFLQNGSTRSVVVMVRLVVIMGYSCHLMSCGFVMVGRVGSQHGLPCWLDYGTDDNYKGWPHIAADTESGDAVFPIYVASYYFCLTTMTSVGYGDIITHNNLERTYVIVLEFVSAIVFATIIAAITSVVTSMDINARNKAEQLDAVASFVEMREFPYQMARRIRRHFRHFYSLKSAVDESKIFSELSSSLRLDVSEYLIRDLMGDDSIFMTMSPTMWPKLLPMLRPMRFERGEMVCGEGDECTDMYVVLNGMLTCSKEDLESPGLSHNRVISRGGNVGALHVLGIWNECFETAIATIGTETYALSAHDFQGLFSAKSDRLAFQKMQRRECRNYLMDRAFPGAPSPFGRPLRMTCFSSLDIEVQRLKLPGVYPTHLRGAPGEGEMRYWTILDLVSTTTGETLNELWRHKTDKSVAEEVTEDGTRYAQFGFFASKNHVRWSDIATSFQATALRVRVFAADRNGKDALLGTTRVPFTDLERESDEEEPDAGGGNFDVASPRLVWIELDPGVVRHLGAVTPKEQKNYASKRGSWAVVPGGGEAETPDSAEYFPSFPQDVRRSAVTPDPTPGACQIEVRVACHRPSSRKQQALQDLSPKKRALKPAALVAVAAGSGVGSRQGGAPRAVPSHVVHEAERSSQTSPERFLSPAGEQDAEHKEAGSAHEIEL